MKVNRQILASIFLVLFGIIQLADLHVVGHDDDDDVECSICKFTLDHHNDGVIPVDSVKISEIITVPADIVRTTYVNRYFGSSVTHSFLNKAPPAV
ncbi:hypothetical protein [Aquimarina aquimarini]|uniref:hypothetical protein n=1 Tax=Aquimarina aquimarini TaxID=1191734 RepID=UPI000D557362|nr:hypothetical protein [Aquimarina aquimarini]